MRLSLAQGNRLQNTMIAIHAPSDQRASIRTAVRTRPSRWTKTWNVLQVRMNMVKPTNSSASSTAPKMTASTAHATSLQTSTA